MSKVYDKAFKAGQESLHNVLRQCLKALDLGSDLAYQDGADLYLEQIANARRAARDAMAGKCDKCGEYLTYYEPGEVVESCYNCKSLLV